jgi:molybdopterin synthase sulfur carrier subunit
MTFKIRLFATLKELAGASQVSVEVKEPATVTHLLTALIEEVPEIESLLKSILIAVNQEYAERDKIIYSVDEIALFPPVSGG